MFNWLLLPRLKFLSLQESDNLLSARSCVLIGNGKCKQLSDWSELELSTADRVIPISALCKFYRDQRAIKVRFVNNFTAAESPLPLFWPGTILDNAKIVLRNNMMTFCIIMLSLPTTIMNIYVYVTGKGN